MKQGDILEFIGDEVPTDVHTAEVLAVCGKVVCIREIYKQGVSDISWSLGEDLVTYGWKIKD